MRILVVEDEPDIADFLSRGLREDGYAVDVAVNGGDTLDCIASTNFDVIILDIMLPDPDGLEVCRRLRARGVRAPVLMLTARDTTADRVTGLDAGADDYLVKPFAFTELRARVRALLRRPPDLVPTTHAIANMVLDPRMRSCTRAGSPIDLTPKEFAILELLVRNPGHVLTREMLADHVWGYDFDAESNVIDVHVRNLRRKVDDAFPTKLIETVRGVGYRLALPEEP